MEKYDKEYFYDQITIIIISSTQHISITVIIIITTVIKSSYS